MKQLFASFALGVLALCASGLAQAEKADRTKPANIEADALRHDDLKQTSVFTGNVVMTKGTIIIRGARLEVRQDAEGYQYGTVWADAGKRAYFKQKRDTAAGAPDEFIEGEGETIEYDGRADNVKFIRRAEMRRLAGNTVNDDVRGDVIVYNNITDVFTVDGNKQNDAKASPGGRVRAVLSPRGDGPGAKPAATPPAGAAAPALRQSTTLDGAPQ
ncbi:lipopolysaccharide transport periplasmic protein LptA [Xylophilus sp. Leaf220]|uniref:lipopolysaccharide transport periplasmic protein LptA n=1 Tax=Xylophilus sp. Leaf220 TaxID=1735686 RepID=UPI0006F5C8D3|nr:lipopolysaccharide transport periplasmic protein LptA [Xylophilus sp. Leaf220]KQM78175.1 organic solvent tolerance protein OstA [Xylophilus sp. Leaf220]